ncbi:MAG: hypothetical protein ACLTW9_04900 [Enterocloster sp.]
MSFLSMKFLLFLAAAVAGYYVIPKQLQWVWLLIFSYIFYLASGLAAVVFILTTTATTFLGGLWLEHGRTAPGCALDRLWPIRNLTAAGHTRSRTASGARPILSSPFPRTKKSLKGAVQTAQEMDCCPGPLL